MLWVIAACLLFTLIAPPAVALVERALMREGPRDVGFWALARSVGGSCHVRWGRNRSPVVRVPLIEAEGRVRARRGFGRRWLVEARAYQFAPFGFAARVCSPPAAPARWRAPGLMPLLMFPEEREHLPDCSFEATDERLLRWLLRHAETRRLLDELPQRCGAESIEVLLAGRVITIRAGVARAMRLGAAVELMGPALVEALRRFSEDLQDLAVALRDAGDEPGDVDGCAGCGGALGEDPWTCPSCNVAHHRGCREMLEGCVTPECGQSADALPGKPSRRASGGRSPSGLPEGA